MFYKFFSTDEQYEGAARLFQHLVNPAEWDTTVSHIYAWKVIGFLVLREKQTRPKKKRIIFRKVEWKRCGGDPGKHTVC